MTDASDRLRLYVAWVVVTIWAIAALVAFFSGNFEELGIVTPVMMIVVGFVFGYRAQYGVHERDKEG